MFSFVIDSDAHQPHWLNQNIARYVARELEITETLLFTDAGETIQPRTANVTKKL